MPRKATKIVFQILLFLTVFCLRLVMMKHDEAGRGRDESAWNLDYAVMLSKSGEYHALFEPPGPGIQLFYMSGDAENPKSRASFHLPRGSRS